LSKRGRDTEFDANIQLEEMLTFFSTEFPPAFPHEISKCVSNNITYHPKEVYAYRGSLSFVQISQNVFLKLGNNVENNDWVLHFLTHGNII